MQTMKPQQGSRFKGYENKTVAINVSCRTRRRSGTCRLAAAELRSTLHLAEPAFCAQLLLHALTLTALKQSVSYRSLTNGRSGAL